MKSILFLLVASIAAMAQGAPCRMTVAAAPELRGFRLGMTADEAKSLYDYIRLPQPDESGFFETAIAPWQLSERHRENLSSLKLGFLDDRLVEMRVGYDDKTAWTTPEEFATAIAQLFQVPDSWQNSKEPSMRPGIRWARLSLSCGELGFEIAGYQFTGQSFKKPTLSISTAGVNEIRDARRAKTEEQKRRTFKP